ncbi:hypothetical protein ACVWZL_003988 [Bradyrhizobium sp. GM2.4]
MSISGVLSSAIEPAHQNRVAFDADQLHDRRADRIRAHRRAQRKRAAGLLVVLRALQDDVAARLVEPVKHFEIAVEIDALDRRHERLEDLEPTYRAVCPALPRGLHPRAPGRADAADEDESGILRRRQLDGDFTLAELVFANHMSNSLLFAGGFSPTTTCRPA